MLSIIRGRVRAHPGLVLALLGLVVMSALTTAVTLAAPPGEPISQIELDLVKAVNAERANVGLPPLTVNYSLMAAAWSHNQHMAEVAHQLGHNNVGDGTFSDRIKKTGYKAITSGENVAWAQDTVDAVMYSWMHSAGHRANILGRNYTDIGVAHSAPAPCTGFQGVGPYWTQVFAAPVAPPAYVTVTPPPGANRPCELDGDFDYDGAITKADINAVAARFMTTSTSPRWEARYDVVPDGVINVFDVYEIVARLGQVCGH
jgi:uncharacterized protein YkwD